MAKRKLVKNETFIMADAILKLENIKKDYFISNNSEPVHALKGVTINFRKNEFVSILGPSGCGKTTLLNIIGGLDKYSDGNLLINGRSTKNYNDRDWDVYRNHRIGFIFQSYNLIPHQTILGNVELALTISGMSKKERIEKAKKALDKVGLEGLYNKHPNQLSGGQCQRVAIARALVNEPEILLADEPTGALDTTTSKQIMDLISEISKEKLVIMVTHNPEIAEEYSTRIIKLLDGLVVSDSNPFKDKPIKTVETNNNEKAKMSFATAFKLSLRNLISKFKRTVLVCVAGSIGIVGVSTVLAVSAGVQNYIESMQDDMLSGNPITISEVSYDLNGLLNEASKFEQSQIVIENGVVNVNSMIQYLIKQSETLGNYNINNNITQDYIDYLLAMPKEDRAAIVLDYGISMSNNIYTDWYYSEEDRANNISTEMSISSLIRMYTSVLEKTEFAKHSSYVSQLGSIFAQAPNNAEYIEDQYDIIKGKVATEANEIMVVINKDSQLTDLVLGQLGYYTQEEFLNLVYESTDKSKFDENNKQMTFEYDEIMGKTFKWYPNDTIFVENTNAQTKTTQPFIYKNTNENNELKDGVELKVVGILQPKKDTMYGCLTTGFYYTEALSKKVLNDNVNSLLSKFISEGKSQLVSNNSLTSFMSQIETPYGKIDVPMGISYKYTYYFEENGKKTAFENNVGFVGNDSSSSFMSILGSMMGGSIGGASSSTKYYSLSLRNIGGNNLANYVKIYPTSFEEKDRVTSYLDAWNEEGTIKLNDKELNLSDRDKISYDDNLEIVINMINTMINIITYALIVFTALSLVVSTVMIGIITYVSVVERVKEIGVIRSLGGRKKDVSHLFNAETFIIGLVSGVFGILITLGLSLIINAIVGHFTGIYTIAALPVSDAIAMITISILLTLISGLIPSRAAANKNPVEALRTE